MVYVTAVHMVGGEGHEHIASVRWQNPEGGAEGVSTRARMVEWIGNEGGQAYVTDGIQTATVGVVQAYPPYIRTYADRVWTDNLLALPRY
jgi:hypothetical protein